MSLKVRKTEKGKELMRGLNTVLENLVTVEVWGQGSDVLLVCLNNCLGLPLTKAQNFKGGVCLPSWGWGAAEKREIWLYFYKG